MSEKKLFIIEGVSSFYMQYCVEASSEHEARELIEKVNAHEFAQQHMGELHIRSKRVTEDEFIEHFDRENEYCNNWTREQKLKAIVRVQEKEEAQNGS